MLKNLHRQTPTLIAIDPRQLSIRNITYHRDNNSESPRPRINRQAYDMAETPQAAWDPRLFEYTQPPNQQSTSSFAGKPLRTLSADAGRELQFYSDNGLPTHRWDSRGHHWHTEFDALLRPVSVSETAFAQPTRMAQRFSYADASPAAAERNQCGRLIRHDDNAGTLSFPEYGLNGEALSESRQFLDSLDPVDWPSATDQRNALLEQAPPATTTRQFSPTGETLSQIDALGNRQCSSYGVSGELSSQALTPQGSHQHVLLSDVRYNAFGQIEQQTAGNGVISRAEYDPADGRLTHLRASRPGRGLVQDLSYGHDPVGNIVGIEDHTQNVQHFANQQVDGVSTYRYDSLYQLIEASGREAIGANIGPQLPDLNLTPGDTSQLVNYTERYTYDTGGNLTELRHIAQNNNYTRRLQIAEDSNRGLPVVEGQPVPDFSRGFDANGNLQALQPGQPLQWDTLNQLSGITLLTREDGRNDDERYVYDSAGSRVRKVQTAHAGAVIHTAEVRYLPGLEIRTKNNERLEVITLQAGRSNVRYLHWAEGLPDDLRNDQVRYSLDDHLGSSTLELDADANLLSHEGYYPYGGTAWWAARSVMEAKYKVVHYSGKERDASGLYYYDFRYYAPWLQRWINPDPAGDIDGLNRYRMVRGNPLTLRDPKGLNGEIGKYEFTVGRKEKLLFKFSLATQKVVERNEKNSKFEKSKSFKVIEIGDNNGYDLAGKELIDTLKAYAKTYDFLQSTIKRDKNTPSDSNDEKKYNNLGLGETIAYDLQRLAESYFPDTEAFAPEERNHHSEYVAETRFFALLKKEDKHKAPQKRTIYGVAGITTNTDKKTNKTEATIYGVVAHPLTQLDMSKTVLNHFDYSTQADAANARGVGNYLTMRSLNKISKTSDLTKVGTEAINVRSAAIAQRLGARRV